MLTHTHTQTYTHYSFVTIKTNVNKNKVRMTVALLTATVFPAYTCVYVVHFPAQFNFTNVIRRQGEIVYVIQR